METIAAYRIRIGLFSANVKRKTASRNNTLLQGEHFRTSQATSDAYNKPGNTKIKRQKRAALKLMFFLLFSQFVCQINRDEYVTTNQRLLIAKHISINCSDDTVQCFLHKIYKYIIEMGNKLFYMKLFHDSRSTNNTINQSESVSRFKSVFTSKNCYVSDDVSSVSWSCHGSCLYLLGNKGSYIYYGNPGRKANPDDPGELVSE